jgi:O-antigen/teichoic acid export membrane protein
MPHSSRVLRNIFWLALEPVLGAVVSLSLAGFVASHLGLRGYGQFTFALSFVVLFGVIANLGMSEVLMRTVASQGGDEAKLWSSVMAAKAILLVVYVGVVAGAAALLHYEPSLVVVIALMGLFQGLLSLEQTTVAMFAGRQDFKPAVALRLAKMVTDATATVAVLLAGFAVVGLAVSRLLVSLVSVFALVAVAFSKLGVRPVRPSPAAVRPVIAAGITFSGISVLIAIGARGGVLVLEHFRGFEAVALFSAAMALVERLLIFLPPVLAALFPFFSAIRAEDVDRFGSSLARALRYQTIVAVGLGLGITLFGPWVLYTFFPRSFDGAAHVVQMLGAYAALRAVADLLNSAAQARGLERHVAWAWGGRCIVNIVVAVALVRPFGALGLAAALVVADVMLLAVLLRIVARAGGLAQVEWVPLAVSTTVGLALAGAVEMIFGVPRTLPPLLAFGAAYPLILVMSGVVSEEDRRYLTRLFRDEPADRAAQSPAGAGTRDAIGAA